MTFLETERLLFRPHQVDDEADFVSMQTDSEVRRYVGGTAWSVEKAVHRFRSQFLGKPVKSYGLWATVLKAEDKYIGYCGLHSRSDGPGGRSAKLAYYLARPYWRRGLATEACLAFLDVAFSRLHLARLSADVEEGNEASEHILRRLGFVFVNREEMPPRIFRTYELRRPEWEAQGNLTETSG